MDSGQPTIDDVRARLEHIDLQVEQAQAHAERMNRLAGELRDVSAEVASPGGEVRVTVDASGRLTDIAFGAAAGRATPDDLRRVLLDALEEGYRIVSGRQVAIAEETLGEQSPTVAMLRDSATRNAPKIVHDDDGLIR